MRIPSFSLARGSFLVRGRIAAAAAVASLGTACVGAGGLTMLEQAPVAGGLPSPFTRVVSYNVLSSHLCEPEHFVKCDAADLDPPTRLRRVQEQLSDGLPHTSRACSS